MKFLALIAVLFATPAWATECETDATINMVREDLLCRQLFNCKALDAASSKDITAATIKLTDRVKDAADKVQAGGGSGKTNPTAIEFYRQMMQAMRDAAMVIDTTISFDAPHAVDFNENIGRYECELSASFNVPAMKKYIRYGNYVGISQAAATNDPSNTMYALVFEMANENNLEKMNQTLAMLFASEDHVIETTFTHPVSLKYSVQTTAQGTLVQVQSFADFMR